MFEIHTAQSRGSTRDFSSLRGTKTHTHTTIHTVMLHPAEMEFLAFVKSKQRERCSKEIKYLYMECSDFNVYILMDSLRAFLVYNQNTHQFIIFGNFVL